MKIIYVGREILPQNLILQLSDIKGVVDYWLDPLVSTKNSEKFFEVSEI
ncbi:MAG: hypothetical protein SNG69_07905 [Rikenellaceae bacterium]